MDQKKLLILSGNSKANILWLKNMRKNYIRDYEVLDISYEHWKKEGSIDFDIELNNLERITKDIKDYYIVAKSAGSILALMGITQQIINPKCLVILGLPLKYIQERNISTKDLINRANNKTKIFVIQQKNDPMGSFEEVKEELPVNIKILEIPGDDHVYENMDGIKLFVDKFINEN